MLVSLKGSRFFAWEHLAIAALYLIGGCQFQIKSLLIGYLAFTFMWLVTRKSLDAALAVMWVTTVVSAFLVD